MKPSHAVWFLLGKFTIHGLAPLSTDEHLATEMPLR